MKMHRITRTAILAMILSVGIAGCGTPDQLSNTQPFGAEALSPSVQAQAQATPPIDPSWCGLTMIGSGTVIGTLNDLVWASNQIITGTVIEQMQPVWGEILNPDRHPFRPIYTDYAVQIEQRFRGSEAEVVHFRQTGGTIDGCTQTDEDPLPVKVGDKILVFLGYPVTGTAVPTYFVNGRTQGYWHVHPDRTVSPSDERFQAYDGVSVPELAGEIQKILAEPPPSTRPGARPVVPIKEAPPGPDLPTAHGY